MARKRLPDSNPSLANWQEVDTSLARIAEHERATEAIEAAMQQRIDEVKMAATNDATMHNNQIALLGQRIQVFVDAHRSELGSKKTKTLTFGKCGYRKSTKVKLPRAAEKLTEIVKKLLNAGMNDCVNIQPPKIDKDALRKYSADTVAEVGATLDVGETFWYETAQEKLAEV